MAGCLDVPDFLALEQTSLKDISLPAKSGDAPRRKLAEVFRES